MSEPSRPDPFALAVRVLVVVLGAAAVFLAFGGCVPYEWLVPLGRLVRRPDDVTPERYARYLHVCWVLAISSALLAVLVRIRSRQIAASLREHWPGGVRVAPALAACFRDHWPVSVVIAAGVGLRIYYLNSPVSYDEAYSFLNFARRPWYEAVADYNSTNNHLLNTLLMSWSYRIWGQQEWALRLGSLAAGVLLLAIVPSWAALRVHPVLGRSAALLTTSLVAISPVLIDYSVNARGYMMVTAAAVALDLFLGRIDRGLGNRLLAWLGAWLAASLGAFAMPIMLYPFVGIVGWFAVAPWLEPPRPGFRDWSARLKTTALFVAIVGVTVFALYAPAYIFRGMLATSNPFVHPIGWTEWLKQIPTAWARGIGRCIAGPIPLPLWAIGGCLGGVAWYRADLSRKTKFAAPFAATFLLMSFHQVAPPPRLFIFLAPWVYLLVAWGTAGIIELLASSPRRTSVIAAILIALLGVWNASRTPVIRDPEQRPAILDSTAAIVHYLAQEAEPGLTEKARLLAPLPADLPVLYHLAKEGFSISVNGEPQPGETIWLITAEGEEPEGTLADQVVKLSNQAAKLAPWGRIRDFPGSTLWLSKGWSE